MKVPLPLTMIFFHHWKQFNLSKWWAFQSLSNAHLPLSQIKWLKFSVKDWLLNGQRLKCHGYCCYRSHIINGDPLKPRLLKSIHRLTSQDAVDEVSGSTLPIPTKHLKQQGSLHQQLKIVEDYHKWKSSIYLNKPTFFT